MVNSKEPLKILWMIPKWTFPVTDGARVATDSLIRNTIRAGAKVDVLSLSQGSELTDPAHMMAKWGVEKVAVIPRSLPSDSSKKVLYYLRKFLLHPTVPLTFSSFTDSRLQKKVANYLQSNKYDFILLDGLHLGAAFISHGKFNLPKTRLIYRAHNIEVDLWKKSFQETRNPFLKILFFIQAKLVEKFENLIVTNSVGIAAIAQEDQLVLNGISKRPTTLIPLGLNFSAPLEIIRGESTKFLFIGRLDWPPNRDGLKWILDEVWPSVIKLRPEVRLKIVGSGNNSWLKNYENLPGLEIKGFVDSIRDAYEDCQFTIVPIFYGSGTRIKVIESFAMNRRLISTKMGVQGAGLKSEDYLNAETKAEWIDLLSKISLSDKEVTQLETSRENVAALLDEKTIGEQFYKWLHTFP